MADAIAPYVADLIASYSWLHVYTAAAFEHTREFRHPAGPGSTPPPPLPLGAQPYHLQLGGKV